MSTMTHPQGLRFLMPQSHQRQNLPTAAAVAAALPSEGWLDRLAAWAERQPSHHHLGHWISLR